MPFQLFWKTFHPNIMEKKTLETPLISLGIGHVMYERLHPTTAGMDSSAPAALSAGGAVIENERMDYET